MTSTLLRFIGSKGLCGGENFFEKPEFIEFAESGKDIYTARIVFDGEKINGVPPYKRHVNTIFQRYALFPHLNVYDNVAFGLNVKKLPKAEIKQRVEEMLKLVNLAGFEKRSVTKLSGGQQQRVAIARALINRPRVLLLDEPLAALDLKLRKDMQVELKNLQKQTGITFIFVTHDQEEALSMSDTVVVMDKGKIQQIGSPTDIYNEPKNAFVADFIGESNIIDGVMLEDFKVRFSGQTFVCVDKNFAPKEKVDIVVRPEDVDVVPVEKGMLKGVVTSVTFKGVHYEMSIRCGRCEILVHSTRSAEVGTTVGMSVVPFNIQIMNKLLPFYDNIIETTVSYGSKEEKYFEFELEKETIKVYGHFFPEGTRVRITLPPSALSLAGDGTGDLQDVYIESVVYKGEHNEIILESDERKWLMLSDTDEQVATYVPLSFDFTKAQFEVLDPEPQNGEGEK